MSQLLSFVGIFVDSPEMDSVVKALSGLDSLVKLYEVTGEYDIVLLLSTADIEHFRDVLKNQIMKTKGVKSTVSFIILKEHEGKSK